MKRLKRFTIIFFLILLLLWTSFYIAVAADIGEVKITEFDEQVYLFYRIMIFPVYDIFFSTSVNNSNFIMMIGYGLNALFQTFVLEFVINLIFPIKNKNVLPQTNNQN